MKTLKNSETEALYKSKFSEAYIISKNEAWFSSPIYEQIGLPMTAFCIRFALLFSGIQILIQCNRKVSMMQTTVKGHKIVALASQANSQDLNTTLLDRRV